MSRHLNNKLDPELEAHGKEVAQRIQAVRRVRQQVLAGMHPACPQDGHPSAYIGLIGAFGTARLVFVCSRGDRFTYNPELRIARLIRLEDWGFIRLEPLNPLELKAPQMAPQP